MGFGDNEPPAVRADPFPSTLGGPAGFRVLVLTFIAWDVIKFKASARDEPDRHLQVSTSSTVTEFVFHPVKSGAQYTFVAQGCAQAVDGSTTFCSPLSAPSVKTALVETGSVRLFLQRSGIDTRAKTELKPFLSKHRFSVRALLWLDG
jgi:hypothetical protein